MLPRPSSARGLGPRVGLQLPDRRPATRAAPAGHEEAGRGSPTPRRRQREPRGGRGGRGPRARTEPRGPRAARGREGGFAPLYLEEGGAAGTTRVGRSRFLALFSVHKVPPLLHKNQIMQDPRRSAPRRGAHDGSRPHLGTPARQCPGSGSPRGSRGRRARGARGPAAAVSLATPRPLTRGGDAAGPLETPPRLRAAGAAPDPGAPAGAETASHEAEMTGSQVLTRRAFLPLPQLVLPPPRCPPGALPLPVTARGPRRGPSLKP